jgi:hypothetical protein
VITISVTATAKLLRVALKRAFPRISFSVRSKSYAGGASIDVCWTDGPCHAAVEKLTAAYNGAQFDGMIDLKTTHTSWLLPDGSAQVAHDAGTVGSMGLLPVVSNTKPHPDAKLVRFRADYIFANRTVSVTLLLRVLDRLRRRGLPIEVLELRTDSSGHAWFTQTIFDSAQTCGFDMEREMRMAVQRTHCG